MVGSLFCQLPKDYESVAAVGVVIGLLVYLIVNKQK